jgi:hypothetical protein
MILQATSGECGLHLDDEAYTDNQGILRQAAIEAGSNISLKVSDSAGNVG